MFIAALFTIATIWKQPKCPSFKSNGEAVVHTYSRMLLSHRKEWNNAICSNMDGLRDCHSKWSESKRERQISYDIAYMWVIVAQLCPTLCDPMDCSLPASFVHGILQARILEWAAISFPRGSSWPRDRTQVSYIASRFFTIWATREAFAYMWNLKKGHRYRKQTYNYHRITGGRMRQINWDIGNDVYVLLYIK